MHTHNDTGLRMNSHFNNALGAFGDEAFWQLIKGDGAAITGFELLLLPVFGVADRGKLRVSEDSPRHAVLIYRLIRTAERIEHSIGAFSSGRCFQPER